MQILDRKNIINIGTGRSIGEEVEKSCVKKGVNVGVTLKTIEGLNKAKKEIENIRLGSKLIVKTADVTKYEEIEKIFKRFNN